MPNDSAQFAPCSLLRAFPNKVKQRGSCEMFVAAIALMEGGEDECPHNERDILE
jgi:hypothetical protein